LHKRFGRGPEVLAGVDLVLEPGTVTEVVGGNGSGKSTLLRIVAGLTRPTAGSVRSRPATVAYAPERLPARLRMPARAYVGHMAALRRLAPAPYDTLLDRFELSPSADVAIATLSKGNRQKVSLAQALAPPAGLVLLDEPASGLNVAARAVLREVLAERRAAGAGILLAPTTRSRGWPRTGPSSWRTGCSGPGPRSRRSRGRTSSWPATMAPAPSTCPGPKRTRSWPTPWPRDGRWCRCGACDRPAPVRRG
jgi:ABC-type transport system involved in cytochrome c biogenesis ATPase subunit